METSFGGRWNKNKILAEIHNLDNKKACEESDISVKIIKYNIDTFPGFVFHDFNNSIFDATFPSELKKADMILVVKKKDQQCWKPVCILPNLSKIYERCSYDRIHEHLNYILSKWQWIP